MHRPYSPPVDTHKCALPTCDRQIARSYLMCVPHWRLLDHATADTLWFAWRASAIAHSPMLSLRNSARLERLLEQAIAQLQPPQATTAPNPPPHP